MNTKTFDIPASFVQISRNDLVDGLEVWYTLPVRPNNLHGPCWIVVDDLNDKYIYIRNKHGVRASIVNLSSATFWIPEPNF